MSHFVRHNWDDDGPANPARHTWEDDATDSESELDSDEEFKLTPKTAADELLALLIGC